MVTYHHGYQRGGQRSPDIDWIHIKDRRTGKVVAEGITAFNSEMVTDEWMWCEVISAPLSAIESGAIRSYRTRDKILALKAETEDFSVRTALYKLPRLMRHQDSFSHHAIAHVQWLETPLRIEAQLIPPRFSTFQSFVMN